MCRQHLLDDIVSKLFQSTIDHNSYGTSLIVTGAGGFGKTSLVTALCHHSMIKEQFADGVVFIELGPQATDPSMKLSQLYHLLTGHYLKQGDSSHAEQEIKQLTSLYCHNLLVIIDDVWHVEDCEPIVKAFSNCAIVLTTRMNDIGQYIPTKQVVCVGPMEKNEAISLLTYGVIDISQLSQEDMSLLVELAQDVHLWPLLLSLIRGQLCHTLKQYKSCYHEAIQFVQDKLQEKGLTAFDKNNIKRSRKYAVKTCIEVTLEFIAKSYSDKMKSLILWTGIGTSLQTAVLHNLWNISEHEARNAVDALWAYGLVQFSDIIIPPYNNTQRCVEVHAVISHYIITCKNSVEYLTLSPVGKLDTHRSVCKGVCQLFQKSSGIYDTSSLCANDYLKYKLNELENLTLPYDFKLINMMTITDPHRIIVYILNAQNALMISPKAILFVLSLRNETEPLINECHKILKDAHKVSRTLKQNVQRCLTERNYDELIQTIETYSNKYPIAMVAQQAATLVKKMIPYCHDGEVLDYIMKKCEKLQKTTHDYHYLTLMMLPRLKLCTKQLQLIYTSLQTGSPTIEATHQYLLSGQLEKELEVLNTKYDIKLQEIAPKFVCK